MSTITKRMIRAAKLETGFYEEVERDTSAMGQAMLAVVLSSVAAGIGSFPLGGIDGIVLGTLGSIIGWFIWAFVIFIVGTKLFPEPQTWSNMGELLRTIGFSSAPGVIRVAGIIPGLHWVVFGTAGLWMLASMIVAVRQALDYRSTWRAAGVVFAGWLLYVGVYAVLSMFIRG